MSFVETALSRKSVRSFLDKPVPRELVEKILKVATFAPTNCNQQLWNFTVIEDVAMKERLIKEAASSTLIRRVPTIVVVSYDGWNYKEAIQGGSLATGHILLAATEYGLGSLPMNSYGADSRIKKILGLPDNQTICCFVLLGYPDERAQAAPLVPRRDASEVVHWGVFTPKKHISFSYDPETWTKADLISHQRFYCRKTVMGKEMDIMSSLERDLVRRELSEIKPGSKVSDLLSYDGAYLREFPQNIEITTNDLCTETAAYTKVAANSANLKVNSVVLDGKTSTKADLSTVIFKLERTPAEVRNEIYESAQGELVIISRKQSPLLALFFFAIKFIFGKDVRKTGIFTFFGPYKPISVSKITDELRQAGFTDIQANSYFALPAFFEQIYQMFLQYRASEGSSYLHRERRTDMISKLIAYILKVQGLRKMGWFGSVAVIRCRK